MSEYTEVEQHFLQQLAELGWQVIDQGSDIPSDPAKSLRLNFRQWLLPDVFARAVSALNQGANGNTWLTPMQLQDLQEQILRQSNRTLLEANESIQKLLFKAQVDVNESTGEQDLVVKLIDFANPANNHFLAINQFRIDTSGCVKQCIIPDIVLFVNGIPLVVVECKKGGATCANPMSEAFEQLQRYMNARKATAQQGLREGEPRFFHTNLLLVRSCGLQADYGTIPRGKDAKFPKMDCEPFVANWGHHRIRFEPADGPTRAICKPVYRSGFHLHDSTKGFSHGCIEVEAAFFTRLKRYASSGHAGTNLTLEVKYAHKSTYGGTRVTP